MESEDGDEVLNKYIASVFNKEKDKEDSSISIMICYDISKSRRRGFGFLEGY